MNKETFKEILAFKKHANIDELRKALDKADWFSPEFLENAIEHAKNQAIRSTMNKCKDADGVSEFLSIIITNEKGEEERVYKQESLFEMKDYEQTQDYHRDRAQHHVDMHNLLGERAYKKFSKKTRAPIQLSLISSTKKATR